MKMRYVGRSISNRYCEIMLQLESGKFDGHETLRCARNASKKMDFYVKYLPRNVNYKCPYVYIKYADNFGRSNFAYIFVRDTIEKDKKKIIVRNSGFKKEDLEVLSDLILQELKISSRNFNQQELQPVHHEQLGLFLSG